MNLKYEVWDGRKWIGHIWADWFAPSPIVDNPNIRLLAHTIPLGKHTNLAFEYNNPPITPEMDLVTQAQRYAALAHWRVGQKRQYTGEPYIVHPEGVVEILKTIPHTDLQLAVGWLHDVIEDCGVTYHEVYNQFGKAVADGVWWNSKVSELDHGNREVRTAIDMEHYGRAPGVHKTVKCADTIHNLPEIVQHNPKFARVWVTEKLDLMPALEGADPTLWRQATDMLIDAAFGIKLPNSYHYKRTLTKHVELAG